jgi:uncharacterized membrane protein HdeD (DUF308 family)
LNRIYPVGLIWYCTWPENAITLDKNQQMNNFQKNSWWIEGLKGIIVLILGIICLSNPDTALTTITIYLGVLALLGGVVVIVVSLRTKGNYWQFWIGEGIFNLVIGLLMVSFPRAAIGVIIVLISLWIVAMSIIQMFTYNAMKNAGYRSPMLIFTAILSLLVGLLLLFNPFEGARIVAIILGVYAAIHGASSMYLSFRLLTRQNP